MNIVTILIKCNHSALKASTKFVNSNLIIKFRFKNSGLKEDRRIISFMKEFRECLSIN